MNIREFLLEKPQENNIISFLQDGSSQSENQNTSEYLSNLKNEVINDFYKNKDKYAKEYEKYNFKDQNLTNPMGNISEYKRDLYDYNKNPSMNADDLSNYILDKQSKFNASKPIFADDNEVVRKSNQFMRDLGDELQKSGRGRLLQDDDGSYWVQDNNGNYSKVQGSTMGNLYRGLRDNGASMALGTAGAIGGTMLGGGVGMVAGGALGASLGAGYDYYGNTKDTNQDMNLKEALMLMGENAGLSLIGDAAFAGVAKGARALKNTYNMAKTGARAGKDMIDGMAVKGGNLKENIGDKLRKISPSILNDLASQGSETSRLYAKEIADSKGNGVYDELLKNANKIPLEVNQGNAIVDTIANKANYFKEMSKNKTINNILEKTEEGLRTFSKNIGSKEAILNQQNLLNMSLMDDDLAKMARDVLIANPEVANKVGNTLANSDEALLKNLKLDNEFSAKNLYDLNNTRKLRAYEEYGKGLDKLDELNPNGIKIDKKNLNDLIQNADFFGQNIPKALKDFLKELNSNTPMSATKLNTRIKELSEEIKTNKSYDFNSFLENLKQNLLDSMVKNATNPQEAKEILTKIRSDYKAFKTYEKSNIADKLSGSEKDITKKLKQLIDETNPKKNYESISKGLNDKELIILDDEIIKRFIDKNKLEFNGKYIVNYPKLMKDIENFTPKSNSAKEKIQVLKSIYNLRSSFEHIIDGIFNTKAKEAGKGISTDFKARAMTMLVNSFTDHVAFIFLRFAEIGKRAGLRIQMRRAFANINTLQDFNKASKEFIESIKDKTLKEEAQEARKEFNSKVKDLIKGDNFFMDKADPKDNSLRFIGKNGKEYTINKDVRNEWMKTFNLKNIDDEYIPNIPKEAKIALKDREIKLTKGSLLKLIEKDRIKYIPHIKETLESPQAILKDKDDFIFIKNIDNQTYFTSIGKDYETHLTIISNSPKKQNNIKNKMKNAEVVYYNNARALPTSRASSETKQVSFSNENSTQAKPKKNLMDDIKENIKNKEVKKKNKKSVKQRLDEKIQNDKKASEDILKRYDNFLKENKDYNLDFLDNMNLNTVEYNLTRQMIINAKESTNKGVKKDIPSALRGKIEQELNIQPLKEFGENYAEYYHDGKGALQKLLIEKQGQVAGAFHRKDLGDIDLVWGDGNFGLSHIVNRREEDFIKQGLNKIEAKNKALNFIKEIENIINNGNVKKGNNRAFIDIKNNRVMVALDYKGKDKKWIITAYNFY
ncbi:PBECR2 nuclease fold domain-containing protein [Campylobacter coli]